MQEVNVTFESSSRLDYRLSISMMGVAAIFMVFVFLYPPFLPSVFTMEYKIIRLFLEGILLFCMALNLLRTNPKIHVFLFSILCLYLTNVVLSSEQIENALSYFNKFAFLLLLVALLQSNFRFAHALKKLWIWFWVYCSIIGIVGSLLVLTNLVNLTLYPGFENGAYYYYPFIGNFCFKTTDLFRIPRYCGFMTEPILFGFFSGFNMLIAKNLIIDPKQSKKFFYLNLLAGLMTVSYAFMIFLMFFSLLRFRIIHRLVSHKVMIVCCIVLGVISLSIFNGIPENMDGLLPYSSLSARIQRYLVSIDFLTNASFLTLIFGAGIVSFQDTIQGGASAGIFDVLASRGIILFGIWGYILHKYAKMVPGLFVYIVFYSLVIDYWHFPLFLVGLALITVCAKSRTPTEVMAH